MYKLYTQNENFFSEPNDKNSYWAGFIAADGGIEKTSNRLRIGLSIKDRELLEVFAQQVEFTGPITDYTSSFNKNTKKRYPHTKLNITSKQ